MARTENEEECTSERHPKKSWKELSIEEKIERMRFMLKGVTGQTDILGASLGRLEKHSHLNNEIVVPLQGEGSRCFTTLAAGGRLHSEEDDDVYF